MNPIVLVLTRDEIFFIFNLSSDDYENLATETFLPADLLYTFLFRYPRLSAHDVTGNDNTNGSPIDFTSTHDPVYAILITIAVGGFAAANFYREYHRQKRKQQNNSYQFIFGELIRQGAFDEDAKEEKKDVPITNKAIWLKTYLENIFTHSSTLQAKYAAIEFDEVEGALKLTPRDTYRPPKKNPPIHWFRKYVINKFLSPVWKVLGVSSFAYWLLWIGGGVFTGAFQSGISGMSPGLGFGIPFAFGFAYAAIKTFRWYKNQVAKKNDPVLDANSATKEEYEAEAKNDSCNILRSAILYRKFELTKKILIQKLGNDYKECKEVEKIKNHFASQKLNQKIAYLGEDAVAKSSRSFFSTVVGTYVGAQYSSWIVTDALFKLAKVTATIPIVNTVCGWLLIVGSLVYGIYNAVTTYESVKAKQAELNDEAKKAEQDATFLDKTYKAKLEKVSDLKKTLNEQDHPFPSSVSAEHPQFFNDVTRQGPTSATKTKKIAVRVLHLINGICTGAFFARLLFVKGTAIFLPFAAVALSNPITLGIVFGFGALYGLFKLYEYHKKRKEDHAKELITHYSQKIQGLKQQIELADLTEQLLQKKIKELPAVKPVISSCSSVTKQFDQQPRNESEISDVRDQLAYRRL